MGSIGVIALHVDQSVKDAKDGIAYTAIYAGSTRTTSRHMRRSRQRRPPPCKPKSIVSTQSLWNTSPRGAGLDPDAIRGLEAGLLFGEAAVASGLADAVVSFEQVLGEFATTCTQDAALHANAARASPSGIAVTPDAVPHALVWRTHD